MKNFGEQFLHKKEPKLHTSKPVEHEMERKKKRGEEISQKPAEKISDWLEIIKRTHTGHRENPEVAERIKEYYRKEYVIKPEEIPESYFETQKRIAREQGHGDIGITEELKRQSAEVIISDQKSTLDNWVDYFTSPDSDAYPMWAKYWAFTSMLKLSTFDKEKHAFAKRDKGTTAPFPDLNREALAYVVDAIVKKAGNEKIEATDNNPELKQLLDGANFGKLYAYAIEKVTPTEENELINTKGEWKKYAKGSDHMPLVNSLQGYGTGWCTAGESTAEAQLKGGDFYVYYSYDKTGKPVIPRVAIRMQDNSIGEVRGIAPGQNLDPYIGGVVDGKLKEFPDGEKYKKKTADMKKLTEIENRKQKGEELTKEDLRFLYQMDSKIKGFGYQEDPRIKELLADRDIKSDLSLVTGYAKEQISIAREEALAGGIKYHFGDLNLSRYDFFVENIELPENIGGNLSFDDIASIKGLKLPENISGNLNLSHLTLADDLKLPKNIGGSLLLNHLASADGLKLPENIGDSIYLNSITSAKGMKLPKNIGGSLILSSVISSEGLELPESIGLNLELSSLTSAKDLKLPKNIGGDLELDNLASAEGLKLPERIGGDLYFKNLTFAEGLKLPESIGGNIVFVRLISAKDWKLPKSISGNLDLPSLTSAESLKLPENIGGGLDLSSLTSAKGLKLPESIGGSLDLSGLISVEDLKLPNNIGGDLVFHDVLSAENLELPKNIGGKLYLSSQTIIDTEKIREKHPQLKIFRRLT